VLDANPSQIFGKITAPGQVFLTNPNGMYFAPSASVEVGGLAATTHSISNADFMAGGNTFSRDGATGSIVNEGKLTANHLGGYIALLAPEVRNQGVIVAQLGTVALAAGEVFELQFDGNNTLANIRVTPASIAALVESGNAVQAPGGLIILSAQALDRLQGGVVNNTGAIEAKGLVDKGGTIRLMASDNITHTGSINVDAAANSAGKGGTATLIADLANHDSLAAINGSISARGGELGGDGGFVETSAGRVRIGNGTRVDTRAKQGKTGMWLLDPTDYTIAASSGDETGASIATSLTTTDRTIAATQDIFINDDIITSTDLGTARTLTFQADRNIFMQTGKTIDATQNNGQPLNVVLNSATAGGVGNIRITGGSSILTNGGDIKLGGGVAGNASGYATGAENTNTWDGYGVALDNATLDAGGGNISIKGHTGTNNSVGVALGESALVTIKTSNSGVIDINGVAGSSSNASYGSFRSGLSFWRALLQTDSGAINLTGVGGNQATAGDDDSGIYISAASWQPGTSTRILSSSGQITLTGTKGTGGSGSDIRIGALSKFGADGTNVASSSSPIRLVGDSIDISETYGGGAPAVSFSTSGQLTVAARTGTSSVTLAAADLPAVIDNNTKKLSWSSNTLSLSSAGDFTITAPITATNAGLDLELGSGKVNVAMDSSGNFTGRVDFFQADGTTPRSGTGFLTINTHPYTVITDLTSSLLADGVKGTSTTGTDLQGINGNLAGYYALGSHIDASATNLDTYDGQNLVGNAAGFKL